MEAVNVIARTVVVAKAMILAAVLLTGGCANYAEPKTVLIDGITTPEHSSLVHPTQVPGGLMLIHAVDQKSTYTLSIGFFGSLYVPPGLHEFEVEVSHGFVVQDAGGPAWTAPPGVQVFAVEGINAGQILNKKGTSRPHFHLEAGKVYEIKFGFDRTNSKNPVPVTWISPIPSA